MTSRNRLNQKSARNLLERLPANTSFEDLTDTFSHLENVDEYTVDELIVKINETTERRLRNTEVVL